MSSQSEENRPEAPEYLSCPFILRSAFVHIKDTYLLSSRKLKFRNENSPCNSCNEDGSSIKSSEFPISNLTEISSGGDTSVKDIGSYTNTVSVDPHWPLCMFELRGRCNNDECPWQHLKDCEVGTKRPRQLDSSGSAGKKLSQ